MTHNPDTDLDPSIILADNPTLSMSVDDRILNNWLRYEFNITPEMRAQCSDTFLRVWEGINFDVFKEGVLRYCGADWLVHWQSTPEVCKSAKQIALSFRVYRGHRFVVVKVWERGNRVKVAA